MDQCDGRRRRTECRLIRDRHAGFRTACAPSTRRVNIRCIGCEIEFPFAGSRAVTRSVRRDRMTHGKVMPAETVPARPSCVPPGFVVTPRSPFRRRAWEQMMTGCFGAGADTGPTHEVAGMSGRCAESTLDPWPGHTAGQMIIDREGHQVGVGATEGEHTGLVISIGVEQGWAMCGSRDGLVPPATSRRSLVTAATRDTDGRGRRRRRGTTRRGAARGPRREVRHDRARFAQ